MQWVRGALLVTGTAIGAGMLALPVATSLGRFVPVSCIFLLCWLFMMATGLLLLEISLWMAPDANMVSMAKHLLGRFGKGLSLVLYLFLFYCLTIAYVAGGGGFIGSFFGNSLPYWLGIVLFTLIFSPVVFFGARSVDRLNVVLMAGLVASYIVFVVIGWKHASLPLFGEANWGAAFLSMPIIFTSFSYQGIIPSLTSYLNRNAKLVRKAIIFGTALPFVVYTIWEGLILGIVPLEGPEGLLATKQLGQTAVYPLKNLMTSPLVYSIGQAFAFFALTTSFLGVTLGLFDFLADTFKIAKKGIGKSVLYIAVFLPPVAIAIGYPDIFITALSYAGGIGCALLLGALPPLMVWVGRYYKGYGDSHQQLLGGKPLLLVLMLFACLEVMIEVWFLVQR